MTMLHQRPRADYEFSTSLGSTTQVSRYLTRWGEPGGSDTAKVIVPETINPARRFSPINILLIARRDSGKTLVSTGIAKLFDAAFWDPKLGSKRGLRRVGSNFWIRFAQNRGPLGREHALIEQEDGSVKPGWIPVDPCSQELPDKIASFPPWSMHRLFVLDEIADVLNSTMAMSRHVRDWSSVFRQQRKLRSEILANTQFPWQVAQNAIVSQIDLVVYVIPHRQTWSADLLFHDLHGQFTGDWNKYARRWPRIDEQPSWEKGIGNLQAVANEYNTFEIIAPVWSKNRDSLISRQYKDKMTWEDASAAEMDEAEAPAVSAPSAPRQPAYYSDDFNADNALAHIGTIIPYGQARAVLLKALGVQVRSHAATQEWLEQHGWQMYNDPEQGQVVRKE